MSLLLWLLFVFVLVLAPLSYGWGIRGWGPPRPRAWRRSSPVNGVDAPAWGALGDAVWMFILIAFAWLVVLLLL